MKAFAMFSGQDINVCDEAFTGGAFTAVFGGVELDARGAIITGDCTVNATAIFGGVDIALPESVNVKVQSFSLFGGVSNERQLPYRPDAPTVYIKTVCLFGGIDIER